MNMELSMKRYICCYLLFLFMSIVIYLNTNDYEKETREMEERADYIISLIDDYYVKNGVYPSKIDDILNVYYADNNMFNADNIPGKGYFIIYNGADFNTLGAILVVGGWNQPNVLYFTKIKKKEKNSIYFTEY